MAVKKKAARRSAQVKDDAPGAQAASERRAAEAEVRGLIDKFAAANGRLIVAVRRTLRKRLPTAHEVVYEYRDFFVISFSPSGHGYEGVFAIHAGADGVKLYFNRGKELNDPAKLLMGTAKLVRYIELERAATLARPEVAGLIDEAIARNPVPFATTGRRSVIVRSTSAKKRRGNLSA